MLKKTFGLLVCLTAVVFQSLVSCQNNAGNVIKNAYQISNLGDSRSYRLSSYHGVSDVEMNLVNSLNYDDKYYMWYFDLGLVELAPVWKSNVFQYQYGAQMKFSFNDVTEETIESALTMADETVDTHSYTGGFTIEAEESLSIGIVDLELEESTDHHWTNNWGTTRTVSNSLRSSYLKGNNKSREIVIEFNEENGFSKGKWYRVADYNDIRAYGVLIYDVEKKKYSYSFLNMFASDNIFTLIEERDDRSDYVNEASDIDKTLTFDLNKAMEIANKNVPSRLHEDETQETAPPINPAQTAYDYKIGAKLLSCAHDNGYNFDQPDGNANNYHYSYNYDFGDFVVGNVGVKIDDANYSIVKDKEASVKFKVAYDCSNLPRQDTMTFRGINDDDWDKSIYNLPGGDVGARTVHKGLLVAYITYEDGSTPKRIVLENVFDGKKAGDEIVIADGIDKPCNINVAICFELVMWAPGFLGISDDYWMDYRINQKVTFQ